MERDRHPSLAPDSGWLTEPDPPDPFGLIGRTDFSLLIVDDSARVRREVRTLVDRLKIVSICREAENGVDALKKALEAPPDLILCDLIMPSVDGFKFLGLLHSRPDLKEIPVILLTGKADVETKIRGLELGASDYVTKPFDAGELLARIKVQLKIKALQDELRRSNEKLRELSSTDPLTGLFNRRFFMRAIETEFERCVRYRTPLSFVMIDIDHFKRLNDTYGHQAGDDVLRQMGDLIRVAIRTTDVPGRYGGEEFCVLLTQTPVEGASEFARRFRQTVEDTEFTAQEQRLKITASLGVSSSSAEHCAGPEDLIRQADEALYKAKAAGRNRVVVGGS